MKTSIALSVLSIVLFAVMAVWTGLQREWGQMLIWSVGTLLQVVTGIQNYKREKRENH